MEKGFNDDELADIMSEIESLEQEFAETDESNVSAQQDESFDDVVEEEEATPVVAKNPQIDKEMDEVLDELSQMPVKKSVPSATNAKVHSFQPKPNMQPPVKSVVGGGAHSSLNFHVEGSMTVQLGFSVGGEVVDICVNEHEGLVITMGSGVKFTVPLAGAGNRKAS